MLLICVTDHFSRPLKIYSLKPQYFIAHLLIAKTQVVILYAFIPKINVKFSINSEKFSLANLRKQKRRILALYEKFRLPVTPDRALHFGLVDVAYRLNRLCLILSLALLSCLAGERSNISVDEEGKACSCSCCGYWSVRGSPGPQE